MPFSNHEISEVIRDARKMCFRHRYGSSQIVIDLTQGWILSVPPGQAQPLIEEDGLRLLYTYDVSNFDAFRDLTRFIQGL